MFCNRIFVEKTKKWNVSCGKILWQNATPIFPKNTGFLSLLFSSFFWPQKFDWKVLLNDFSWRRKGEKRRDFCGKMMWQNGLPQDLAKISQRLFKEIPRRFEGDFKEAPRSPNTYTRPYANHAEPHSNIHTYIHTYADTYVDTYVDTVHTCMNAYIRLFYDLSLDPKKPTPLMPAWPYFWMFIDTCKLSRVQLPSSFKVCMGSWFKSTPFRYRGHLWQAFGCLHRTLDRFLVSTIGCLPSWQHVQADGRVGVLIYVHIFYVYVVLCILYNLYICL